MPLGAAGYTVALVGAFRGAGVGVAVLLAVGAAFLLGLGTGFLSLKVRGPFLVVATLALAEIAHEVAVASGFITEQGYAIGGEGGFPVAQFLSRGTERFYLTHYYLSAVLLVLVVIGLRWLVSSNWGLMLKAAGSDELSAQSVGVNTAVYRILAFVIASTVAGLVGIHLAYYLGRVTPSMLSLELSFSAIVLSVLGKRGSIMGPAVAAYLATVVFGLFWVDPTYQGLIYATALLVAIRLLARL